MKNRSEPTYSVSKGISKDPTRRMLADWELRGLLPSLSIIVLNYQGEDLTARCLQSIAYSKYEGLMNVVLVDNGATASSIRKLKAVTDGLPLHVEVITSAENLGFSGGVLAAWPHAT